MKITPFFKNIITIMNTPLKALRAPFLASMAQPTRLSMLTFISFPLAFTAMKILFKKYRLYEEIIPAQALTIQVLIAHGLLLSLGLIF